MQFLPVSPVLFRAGLLAAALVVGGCGGNNEPVKPTRTVKSSLKQIAVLYGQFTGQHRGRSPSNEKEFRAFIKKQGEAPLKSAAVSSVDELFKSPRDEKPFVILYGVKTGVPGQSGPIVAYEETVSDGSHVAVDTLGGVRTISEAEAAGLKK